MTAQGSRFAPARTALVCSICVSALIAALVPGRFPVIWLWYLVGWTVAIAVHEFGHAAGAFVASIPVYRIVIGTGPVLWLCRLRHAAIEVRVVPMVGHVEAYPSVNDCGGRRALFVICGPMANLALFGLLLTLLPSDLATATPLITLAAAQMVVVLMTLWPGQNNDGRLLLDLLERRADDHRAAVRAYLRAWTVCRGLPTTAASERLAFHHSRFPTGRAEAWDDLRHELAGDELSAAERVWALDALVTSGLVSGDPALRPYLGALPVHATRP